MPYFYDENDYAQFIVDLTMGAASYKYDFWLQDATEWWSASGKSFPPFSPFSKRWWPTKAFDWKSKSSPIDFHSLNQITEVFGPRLRLYASRQQWDLFVHTTSAFTFELSRSVFHARPDDAAAHITYTLLKGMGFTPKRTADEFFVRCHSFLTLNSADQFELALKECFAQPTAPILAMESLPLAGADLKPMPAADSKNTEELEEILSQLRDARISFEQTLLALAVTNESLDRMHGAFSQHQVEDGD